MAHNSNNRSKGQSTSIVLCPFLIYSQSALPSEQSRSRPWAIGSMAATEPLRQPFHSSNFRDDLSQVTVIIARKVGDLFAEFRHIQNLQQLLHRLCLQHFLFDD